MKTGWALLAIVVILFLLFRTTKIQAAASIGNPNAPTPQPVPVLGPQGPNDGSNNPTGSGATMLPTGPDAATNWQVIKNILSGSQMTQPRGFSYGASSQPNVY